MSRNSPYTFNIRKSLPDKRDYSFKQENSSVRPEVNLTQYDSAVGDQDHLGSCASFSITSAYENLVNQKYPNYFSDLSKLYHYYHTRYLERTVGQDFGVLHLRNAFKSIKDYCICAEEFWIYNVYKFDVQPPPPAYSDSTKRTILNYASLNGTTETINAINENYPVVVGMDVFHDFMELNSSNPVLSMPGPMDYSLGGHAVCLVGYSIPEKRFLAKNSFGKDWGNNGYCWIPFDYSDSYIFDRWIFNINNQQLKYEV